jgi:hypothetical protein
MRTVTTILVAGVIAAAAIGIMLFCRTHPARAEGTEAGATSRAAARLVIPASIEREHRELHERLAAASRAGGKTAAAAKKLADLLHPHLAKEEQFALPPLGMLRAFADGEVPANAEEVLALTEKFRAEYPRMLEEHEAIVAALGDLLVVARAEGHTDTAEFAQELLRHAEHEEEILYPTTVLIGEYVKLMVAKDAPGAKRAPAPAQR